MNVWILFLPGEFKRWLENLIPVMMNSMMQKVFLYIFLKVEKIYLNFLDNRDEDFVKLSLIGEKS